MSGRYVGQEVVENANYREDLSGRNSQSTRNIFFFGMLGVIALGITMSVSEWNGVMALPPDPMPALLVLHILGAQQVGMISVILTFRIGALIIKNRF